MPHLMIVRPHPRKPEFFTSEWLKGETMHADAADEALALLADPRDTISSVWLWDTKLQQFGMRWRRQPEAARDLQEAPSHG